jgi:hypothetical protein
MINEWFKNVTCYGLFILLSASAGPVEEHPPRVLVPPGKNIAGLQIITEDGGHLAWSKKTHQIAFDRLGKDGYFDLWIITPDGEHAWKIHAVRDEVSKNAAGVLHPHFSNDGTRLFWAERIRDNGRKKNYLDVKQGFEFQDQTV